jgi:hypothetical protein
MGHLKQTGFGYFEHLTRAWHIAGVLVIHGIFPNVWPELASRLLCDTVHGLNATEKQ